MTLQSQQPQIEASQSYFKAFLESSLRSLEKVDGLRLYAGGVENIVQDECCIAFLEDRGEGAVEIIRPELEAPRRPVVAIDTSSIRVAAGSRGVVIAVRGAIVTRDRSKTAVEVLGPLVFYVSYENMGELLASVLGAAPLEAWGNYQLYNSIQRVMAGLIEKRMQEYAAEHYTDSILLFDGSLSAGPLDNPLYLVGRILEKARPRGNDILAFSKTSVLRVWGELLTTLGAEAEPPYLVEVTQAVRSAEMRVRVLGDIFLARLCPGCSGFRVDASITASAERVFGSLLRSDALVYGYPETLILAHDYCTFSKLDVLAIQAMLRRRSVEIIHPTSIRDLLFNPVDGEVFR